MTTVTLEPITPAIGAYVHVAADNVLDDCNPGKFSTR